MAREACNAVFGETRVTKITDVLHRSQLNYEELLEGLKKYDSPSPPSTRNPVYLMVLESVRKELSIETPLIPHTTGAVKFLPEFPGAKSPGLPWKLIRENGKPKYRSKKEVLFTPEHESHIRQTWQEIGDGRKHVLPDVCLFARSQIARKGKSKIRPTWCYPLAVYAEEARFFYPIHNWIKQHKHAFNIAYGFEMAHGGMQQINEFCQRGEKFLVGDWSGFDSTVPAWMIRDAFDILKPLIDMTQVIDAENKIWPVSSQRSLRRWKKMVDYFVATPIRTCKGDRFEVVGGVPSGSCFTNLIDSIVNCIAIRYVSYQCTGNFPVDEIFLGDDIACSVTGIINIDDWADVAEKTFGMKLNASKTYVTSRKDNVHFLGYFNKNGVPFKNQDFLIASFVQPEHTRRTAIEAASAALGQLWTGFDPVFGYKWFEVIQFICRRYGHTLGEVQQDIRSSAHRHKYLNHVGYDPRTITLPKPTPDMFVVEVLPKLQSRLSLKTEK